MRVLADENMPALELWRRAGHSVSTLPGRAITRRHLMDRDILLVRSVTRVDEDLVRDTPLRFVGSATSGTDHIDTLALAAAGIHFAYAPASNARSVVDYVLSVLAARRLEQGVDWLQGSLGIIGCGRIGGALRELMVSLGLPVKVYDPLLAESSCHGPWLDSLDAVLACDVVSLHAPLTMQEPHPSWHMLSADRLQAMDSAQLLISAGRGAVVHNHALAELLAREQGPCTVLDVWEPEPAFLPDLARRVWLGTPHIAGYSSDGKIRGTQMLLDAFNASSGADAGPCATAGHCETGVVISADRPGHDLCLALSALILSVYDVRQDAARFSACHDSSDAAQCFDSLRRDYPERREIPCTRVQGLPQGRLAELAAALGFMVAG